MQREPTSSHTLCQAPGGWNKDVLRHTRQKSTTHAASVSKVLEDILQQNRGVGQEREKQGVAERALAQQKGVPSDGEGASGGRCVAVLCGTCFRVEVMSEMENIL